MLKLTMSEEPTKQVEKQLPVEKDALAKESKVSEWKLIMKWTIRRPFLLKVILPVFLVSALIYGPYSQGFIPNWYNHFRAASLTLTVNDQKDRPIDGVVVMVGDASTVTDTSGTATLSGLVAGKRVLSLHRVGFLPLEQNITLKRGSNNLGVIKIDEVAVKKVTLTLSVTDYISNAAVSNADVALDDLKPTQNSAGDVWTFTLVPVGNYKLTVSANGYNTSSTDVTVTDKSAVLDAVRLVKTGVVVFESNRDKGLRGIYTANYDGSAQKALIARVGSFEDYSPSLSPTQTKVFFFSTRDGVKISGSNSYQQALYLINIDGTGLTKISDNSEPYNARWSPDGNYISYTTPWVSQTGYKLRLYKLSNKQIVAFDNYVNIQTSTVAVSADGQYIAFDGALSSAPGSYVMYIANTDGSNVRTVDSLSIDSAEFTAAGKLHYSYYDNSQNTTRYFEYNPADGTKAEVTAPAIDKVGATLSPSEKLRTYVSTRDGKANLFVSASDGSH
ncbi:MAG TPA: carboxypeptidase regulatory-like domain-containing protein, partial [Candidatus Saccharimonadales bacterium]|nr:carboxypeptidase regulatory-like domain-containing protein [Candidatus Saccharimonadales bacterium]